MQLILKDLIKLCDDGRIKWTLHALKRIRERGLTSDEVINAVRTGIIIEQYPEDKPFSSCLILGMTGVKPIHVVISSNDEYVYMITTYVPNGDEWEGDYRTRKGMT